MLLFSGIDEVLVTLQLVARATEPVNRPSYWHALLLRKLHHCKFSSPHPYSLRNSLLSLIAF